MAADRLSLRRNFSWTMFGNVVYAFCLWGILAILTKLGDESTVGRFALASAVASPVIMFAGLQLRSVLAADPTDRIAARDYVTLRLLLLPPALAVVYLVASRHYAPAQVTAIMLFGLARATEMTSDIFYGVAQKHDRMDIVSRSKILKGLLSLVAFGAVFALSRNLDLALVALVAAWALPLLVYDLPRVVALNRSLGGPSLQPRWNAGALRALTWTTLPLGFVILLGQMRQTIPRTLLEANAGEATVGVYAALSYVVLAGTTVVMALGQSTLARLARQYEAGDLAGFRRLGLKLTLLGVGIGVGGVVFAQFLGPWFLGLVYTAEYAAHAPLFVLIMAGGGLFYVATLLAPLTTAMRAFRGQLLVQALQVGVLFVLARTLIPDGGMSGAAWAVLGAGATSVAGFAALIWCGVRLREGRLAGPLALLFR